MFRPILGKNELVLGAALALALTAGCGPAQEDIPSALEGNGRAELMGQQELDLRGDKASELVSYLSQVVHIPLDPETGESSMKARSLACTAFGGEGSAQFICQIKGEELAQFSGTLAEKIFLFLQKVDVPPQMVAEGTLAEIKDLTCDTLLVTQLDESTYLSTRCQGIIMAQGI